LGTRTKTGREKMLTKKHFEKMALIILNNTSNFKNLSLKSEFIDQMANYFFSINPNFDKTKFVDACHNSKE
jgi:hypothetical protein